MKSFWTSIRTIHIWKVSHDVRIHKTNTFLNGPWQRRWDARLPSQHLRTISRLHLSKCHADSIPAHISRPFWEALMHRFRIRMEDGAAQMSGLNLWSGGHIAFISTIRAVSLLALRCHNDECVLSGSYCTLSVCLYHPVEFPVSPFNMVALIKCSLNILTASDILSCSSVDDMI